MMSDDLVLFDVDSILLRNLGQQNNYHGLYLGQIFPIRPVRYPAIFSILP